MGDGFLEEWRDIPNWEGFYQASSLGRIRSVDRVITRLTADGAASHKVKRSGRTLKPFPSKDYLMVMMSRGGTARAYHVHGLVCAAFYGSRPTGAQTAHNNGIRDDCRASNVRWATARENCADKVMHGTAQIGERNGNAKLSDEDVRAIRQSNESARALGAKFKVHHTTILLIKQGKTWNSPPRGERR